MPLRVEGLTATFPLVHERQQNDPLKLLNVPNPYTSQPRRAYRTDVVPNDMAHSQSSWNPNVGLDTVAAVLACSSLVLPAMSAMNKAGKERRGVSGGTRCPYVSVILPTGLTFVQNHHRVTPVSFYCIATAHTNAFAGGESARFTRAVSFLVLRLPSSSAIL